MTHSANSANSTYRAAGPWFTMGDYTILADETRLYSVYANGYAPLSGGGANGRPAGQYLGRVWQQAPYGWVAAPKTSGGGSDSWSREIDRSHRHFRTRRDACMFLYGYERALGRARYEAAMAEMPAPMGGGRQPAV